jgi:hypothetical protein
MPVFGPNNGVHFRAGSFERTKEKIWLKKLQQALKTFAAYRVVCVDRHC